MVWKPGYRTKVEQGTGDWSLVNNPASNIKQKKSGKGPGSVSMYFLSTITSQNFEEPIRLQNETTQNVIPSHAHEAKSANYAIW